MPRSGSRSCGRHVTARREVVRSLRGGVTLPSGTPRSLLSFAQLSDVHIIDAQSPARVEYFARTPGLSADEWPYSSAFRAHETLSTQLLVAALQAIAHAAGPATGKP